MEKTYGKDVKNAMESEINVGEEKVKKEVMTAMFLSGSDRFCCGPLKSTLAQHVDGNQPISSLIGGNHEHYQHLQQNIQGLV